METLSSWLRLLVPSAGDVIFIALLAVLVFTPLSVRLLGDAGIGWHIRTGQLILQTGKIPRVDPFSSTMQGKPWFAWEWLYDEAVGAANSSAGLDGVVVFNAAVIAFVFSLLFNLLRRRGTELCLALLLTILAAAASMVHFLARPHVTTWLFVVLWLRWLDDSEVDGAGQSEKRTRRLRWLLPVSMALWVNLHGGFITALVLLIAFLAGQWVEWRRSLRLSSFAALNAGTRLHTLTFAGIVSALATLLNPYGWHLHAHIYRYLTSRWLMNHVQEFQSPNFHDPAAKCFAALLALTLVAFGVRSQSLRLTDYLLVLFATASGLYSARNLPVAAILLAVVGGPLLSGVAEQSLGTCRRGFASRWHRFSQRMGVIDAGLRGNVWPGLVLTIVIAAAAKGASGGKSLINADFDPHRFPEAAMQKLKAASDNEPVFVPDFWGGYVIYQLYPARLVVVDDRHDLYGQEFFKCYLKTYRLEAGWEGFLDRYGVNLVVAPRDGALAQGLGLHPGWQAVETDEVAVTFRRRLKALAY